MKGYFGDILTGTIWILVFVLVLAVIILVVQEVESSGAISTTSVGNETLSHGIGGLKFIDMNIGVLFIVGIGFFTIISAFLVRSHPVLFLVMFFVTIVTWYAVAPLSNAMHDAMLSDSLSAATNEMTISVLLIDYLPPITLILSMIVAIVMAMPRR